jgi:drug/metabolite transporter (DMT)-like permease
MSALLALVAAAGYAASDVTTARTVRRVRPAAVALWAHVIASVVLLAAALATSAPPAAAAMAAALAAGLVAGAGAVAYYRALKRGSASLLAPVAAAGLVLPVTVGVLREERTALLAALGTGVLLAGVALLAQARGDGARADRTAIALALAAAAGFGSYFVVLDAAVGTSANPLWIAGLVTVGSALAAVPPLLRAGGVAALRPPAVTARPLLAVGLFLAIADFALAAAMAKGDVALVSVISSSDPVLTVVAARLLLEERVSRPQAAAVALALTGLLAVAAA